MPGLCAVVLQEASELEAIVDAMLRRMTPYPWLRTVRHVDARAGIGLGAVTLEVQAAGAMSSAADRGVMAVVAGEILDARGERRLLHGSGAPARGMSDAEVLLEGWRQRGIRFLAGLDGEFVAVIWDQAARHLHVITDRFGLRPLYVADAAGSFVAASEVGPVLELPGIDATLSERGMAQFFGFGHFLNDDTLLSDVRAVPPATIGTFRSADRAYTEAQYWQLRPTRASQSSEALAATLEDRFVAAVATRAKPGERLGLSLSGGLDARTILGVMPEGANLQTISLGIDGSLDHLSASQLASIAAVPHHPFVLGGDFLTDFERHLRQMVRLTDGHYIDQGIVLPVMDLYRQLGIDYLLRGHGGELLHMRKAYAYSLDDAALGASPAELRTWLLSHLSDYMLGGVPDHLFTFDLRGAAEASLDAALERCQAADRPVDKVWQLFLNERIHRETTLSMHTFECFAAVRQPYLDNDVIDALFSMPAEMKLGDALQVGILRHRRPAFLGVTNSNTGTRLGAGRLETALARLRLRVGARLGLKGYQPYERLGLWLRRELRGFVQRTLSGPFVLDQSLIRADVVKRVVEEHLDERANHTFLIMALLIFALGEELRADARRRQGLVESGAGRGAVP